MPWCELQHASSEALAEAVAMRLHALCRAALEQRGRAVLVLAGGSTPLPAYRRLAKLPLDWSAVTLVPTDERWVSHRHPASNGRALGEAFAAARGARVQPLVPAAISTHPSPALACATLAALPEPFDAVLLGMGADGHTASLFPGTANLRIALAERAPDALAVVPVPPIASAPYERITLSAARLLRTRALMLALSGEDKQRVLRQAQAEDADAERLPIAALLHARAPEVEIHWSP